MQARENHFSIRHQFPQVSFGTSGVRALVSDLTQDLISAYIHAFMQRMHEVSSVPAGAWVAVAMDLRPSSPSIAAFACAALQRLGYQVEFLGTLPTPALALRCLEAGIPGLIVTGSHIPFDRNGIKFYRPDGEILKADEEAMLDCPIPVLHLEEACGQAVLPEVAPAARRAYQERYLDYFGIGSLAGLRLGLHEHSAVGRDLTKTLLEQLGAEVICLGRSETFVPVDTEAVAEADLAQARAWCKEYALDALVSTDGDGDRPLVFDEEGRFVRGDLLGLLCARALGIRRLAVPVSCNTAIELSEAFDEVVRTPIGSPFVISAMQRLVRQGPAPVAGFEANGGFLLGSGLPGLAALPTRDALLPMLALLAGAARAGGRVSSMVAGLPKRFCHSDRIKAFPTEQSHDLLLRLTQDGHLQASIAGKPEAPLTLDKTDGVRMSFADGDIVHLRASGNAPELRCYAEAASPEEAQALCTAALARVKGEVSQPA